MAADKPFKLIAVEDDDELVVHAGSGGQAAPSRQEAAAAAPASFPAADAAAAGEGGGLSSDAPRDESDRQRELRRRAERLAQAEEDLGDPKAFSGMRTAVLVVVALVVVAIVAYMAGLRL